MNTGKSQDGSLAASLMRRRWVRWIAIALTGLALVVLGFGVYLAAMLMQDEPVAYADPQQHFMYGSTGGERVSGFPYWIFQAMPRVCSKHLPGGYASLGLIFEDGHDLPVGMSKRRYQGIDRTFLNCAVCHTSTVRASPDEKPVVIAGMPANTFNIWAFQKFFFDCGKDGKFAAEFVVPEVDRLMRERGEKLGPLDRYVIYPVAVALMRERLIMLADRLSPLLEHPEWGPGRVDTFNAAKVLFNFPLRSLPAHELNAPSDFPSIWLQQPRKDGKMQLHWDGNNVKVEERNRSAAFGTGTTPATLDNAAIVRIEDWLLKAEPPKYRWTIDPAKAARGAKVYAQYCAECHGASGRDFAGKYVGQVTPLPEIGTDRRRLASYTYDLAVNQATLYIGEPWQFRNFRKTFGYANMPLDGIWLRAPYLHNGSVPTLRDLLEPVGKRPVTFYRGNDLYDQKNVGFVGTMPELNGRKFFPYDTRTPGNSNAGHVGKRYGTELADADKDAVVEYLKTF